MAKTDKKIRDPKIQEHINNILSAYTKEQKISAATIEEMKALRERFIEHAQPTIVKSIRLAYEHIAKFGEFKIEYRNNEEAFEDEDGETSEVDNELPVPIFEYYIGLLSNPTNKYNRDEIKEINILLKESLEENPYSAYEQDEE